MLGTVAYIAAVVLGVIGLAFALVINANTLRRDLNRRRDEFRARIENEGNAILDHLLNGHHAEPKNHPK